LADDSRDELDTLSFGLMARLLFLTTLASPWLNLELQVEADDEEEGADWSME